MKRLLRIFLILLAVVVIVPFAIVFLRPNKILSKEQAKHNLSLSVSHFITWKGAEVHYTDEGSGFPLLMIHGFGGSYRNFDSLVPLLKDSYRVIRVDLPGFGLSDFPEVTDHEDYIADYRNYLSFILDTLHLDSVYVMGNSMGGGMAWMMAAEHPDKVRKLVLLNSAGYDTKSVAAKLSMFKYKSFARVFDRGMPLFMSESGIEKCYADDTKIDPTLPLLNNQFSNREGNIKHMLALARSQQFPDTAWIKNVKCPTLIIWGKQDEIIPVEHAAYFKRDIANSKLIVYDPCGHVPMSERAHDLAKDFQLFIDEKN